MDFKNSVSTKSLQNDKYRFFKLERAIENLPSSSILIASLYRQIGLSTISENQVSENSTKLFNAVNDQKKIGNEFKNEELKLLFNTALNIPISQTQQNSNKFWISPIIPSIGSFGLASRDSKNPWNPGSFLIEIISNSAKDQEDFLEISEKLFKAFNIDQEESVDLWSIVLESEFKAISSELNIPVNDNFFDKDKLVEEYRNYRYKKILHHSNFSKNLITDLNNLLDLENELNRQQWIGLMEAYFRLTMFNHIINTLNLSRSYYDLISFLLSNNRKQVENEDFLAFINLDIKFKNGTEKVKKTIKTDTDTKFINLNIKSYCLYNTFIEYISEKYEIDLTEAFDTLENFKTSTNQLLCYFDNQNAFYEDFQIFLQSYEKSINEISENGGTLKNIRECLEYLGRKKSIPIDYSRYIPDVNYIFSQDKKKRGSPFMFELSSGIVSVLTGLIFKKLEGQNFISGLEFVKEINSYNIELSIKDISEGLIKNIMLSLGVVIDSPDTEGGVLIVKPGWIS